jgi:hypothetical protein
MKKILLMLLALGIVAPALRAQDSENKRSLVVNAVLNTSKFSEENSGDSESMICPCLGVETNLYQQGPVQFSSGLLYMRSGSGYKFGEEFGEGGSYSNESRIVLTYLSIPAEARYEFGAGNVKPFVRSGGMLGFLLSAKSKNKTGFGGQENKSETDIKNQKKSTNLGLILGGGVSFPLGKFRGIASLRYAIGLTNVVKDDRAPSAKTRDLLLSFGIGFPIL